LLCGTSFKLQQHGVKKLKVSEIKLMRGMPLPPPERRKIIYVQRAAKMQEGGKYHACTSPNS